jgi:phthiocerol/phenolphthiocerol synthesis type-I polyketide synthase E
LPPRSQWEEWLTEHGPSHSVSRKIQRAKDLDDLRGEFLSLSADVTDVNAMGTAWAEIEEKLGIVNGVVHAAGLAGGLRFITQDMESAEEILKPKVKGSQVLAGMLTGKPIDFLLFCSSISTVTPAAGAAAYMAANVFQDRYATWCRQHLGIPAIAVDLDAWQDVGMAAELEVPTDLEHLKAARLRDAMSPQEGVEVIERALALNEEHVLISTRDFPRLHHQIARRLLSGAKNEPEVSAPLEKTATENEHNHQVSSETQAVIAIWRELLGETLIAPEDNFFELGGHSLLGTMVLARIRDQFGVNMSIRAIFDAPTPQALGQRIREATPVEIKEQPVITGEREEFEI